MVVKYELVGYGVTALDAGPGRDRLYLDVGNRLGPGVIDHHQIAGHRGSTAGLVFSHPAYVRESLRTDRRPEDPFTVVLHEKPDLDCVISTYLALSLLQTQAFPSRAESLVAYADGIDAGYPGVSWDRPFTLYAGCMLLGRKSLRDADRSGGTERFMNAALTVVDYAAEQMNATGISTEEVDAFEAPGVFDSSDRDLIINDREQYREILADPRFHARKIRLLLPSEEGGQLSADTLLIRDLGGSEGPAKPSLFLKDWARTDVVNSEGGQGFTGLSVYYGGENRMARCIISVKPGCGVTLASLGDLLDRAESEERRRRYGCDDRVNDPVSGKARQPRPGYGNADPWYDGRGHAYTIIDSPRNGTVLSAEVVESLLLRFGSGDKKNLCLFLLKGGKSTINR